LKRRGRCGYRISKVNIRIKEKNKGSSIGRPKER
jgi:hypothetical protein